MTKKAHLIVKIPKEKVVKINPKDVKLTKARTGLWHASVNGTVIYLCPYCNIRKTCEYKDTSEWLACADFVQKTTR
jgi:hypothetical protein